MKISKMCRIIGLAFLASAFLASAPALSAAPANDGKNLPAYMLSAANIDDHAYMACIRARIKGQGDKNIVEDHLAALGCQHDILKN